MAWYSRIVYARAFLNFLWLYGVPSFSPLIIDFVPDYTSAIKGKAPGDAQALESKDYC
jgi:hypothetical protein